MNNNNSSKHYETTSSGGYITVSGGSKDIKIHIDEDGNITYFDGGTYWEVETEEEEETLRDRLLR